MGYRQGGEVVELRVRVHDGGGPSALVNPSNLVGTGEPLLLLRIIESCAWLERTFSEGSSASAPLPRTEPASPSHCIAARRFIKSLKNNEDAVIVSHVAIGPSLHISVGNAYLL